MKLSEKELCEVEHIRNINRDNIPGIMPLHILYLLQCIDTLNKEEARERFETCKCYGWGGYVDGIDPNCKTCKGRGIVHVGAW